MELQRAFPLDSRTVWVEQQIVMNGIVSRDNLYVGPMDYNPKIPEKHIPTPTIARPKTVDTFHPYKGNCGGTVGLSKRGSGKLKTKKKKSQYMEPLGDIRGTFGDSRSEYATPFSDHDKRMPIDPSRRYYITDTPSLPIDPFLHSRYHCDGARGPAKVGGLICQDRTERMRAKPAMPQSDSVYNTDTPLVNKRPVGGEYDSLLTVSSFIIYFNDLLFINVQKEKYFRKLFPEMVRRSMARALQRKIRARRRRLMSKPNLLERLRRRWRDRRCV